MITRGKVLELDHRPNWAWPLAELWLDLQPNWNFCSGRVGSQLPAEFWLDRRPDLVLRLGWTNIVQNTTPMVNCTQVFWVLTIILRSSPYLTEFSFSFFLQSLLFSHIKWKKTLLKQVELLYNCVLSCFLWLSILQSILILWTILTSSGSLTSNYAPIQGSVVGSC